jgi:hypothetical protein
MGLLFDGCRTAIKSIVWRLEPEFIRSEFMKLSGILSNNSLARSGNLKRKGRVKSKCEVL